MKSTGNKETEAKEEMARVAIWAAKITEAEDKSKAWWRDAKSSFDEFIGEVGQLESKSSKRNPRSKYPVWWSSVKTVQPALYSRTPNTIAHAVISDVEDQAANLASICLERLAKQLIEAVPFDRVQYYTRDMYIHSGRTTNRVCFKSKTTQEKVYVTPTPEQPLDGNTEYFQEAETGQIYYLEDKLETASVTLEPLHYKDMLHSPCARWEEEIDWKAYKALMTKEDASERFGKDVAALLKYSYSSAEDDKQEGKKGTEEFACVWEIWDKRKKKVCWYSPELKERFLDERDDPYELVGFFPSPPLMLGTVGADDLYPVPDFIQLEPLINQLNGMFQRYRTLVIALKRKGIFDESYPELKVLANTASEAEYIGIKNFKKLVDDGGIDKVIAHFPTGEFSKAVVELANVIQDFEQKFYELYGIPDILRGVSDPRETAAAQQQKDKFLSLRFSAVQREFQRLARDSIELMCDLALKLFDDQKLADLMGFNFFKPEEQALLPQVLEILRNDQQRQLRIDIETDSTITMNEVQEIEQRQYLAKSVFDGLGQIKGLAEDRPEFMPIVGEVISYVIAGLRNGKQIQGTLRGVLKQLAEPPPEPPPPPPDPMLQKIQIEAQLKMQELNQQSQLEQAKLQLQQKQQELDSLKLETEQILKGRSLDLQAQQLAADSQLESVKLSIQSQAQAFDQQMQQLKAELDKYQVVSSEKEKMLTELRLQREERREEQQALRDSFENQKAPAINLTVEAAKPTKKRAKLTTDAFGNRIIETEELPEGQD